MTWIDNLPEKLFASINSILDSVEQHEDVYTQAENSSIGQMWVAIAYLNHRLEKMEELVMAQRKVLQEMDKEVNVDNHLDDGLRDSLKNY